ncbi:LIM domain-containing protein WLIM2b-like [Herrania umbratica]|uniref:LIM domain-containing protein WLIM2b-like n=1 Tax=Herrania umbratica TaxID=108875 RepID=A0A6J1BCE4_9ROSI|nr:LIM domain-containing protein WLIM2b-like [Herrania umbratica]
MEGVLYCKPHFEQLFKETGNFNKNFQSPAKSAEKLTPEMTRSPSKAASMFSGTQEKCATCGKTAYPLEKVTVEGQSYHKSCFKCSHGGCPISPSNYAALEGILYCKHHFSQLFKEKGSYNHLIKSASIKLEMKRSKGDLTRSPWRPFTIFSDLEAEAFSFRS